MEDTLREETRKGFGVFNRVLILVLMEDTLRVRSAACPVMDNEVLILVLMEDTLRESKNQQNSMIPSS